jgi:hypothetical protein
VAFFNGDDAWPCSTADTLDVIGVIGQRLASGS